jgi:hypothetical protein
VAVHCPQLKTLELQCPLLHSNLSYKVRFLLKIGYSKIKKS